MAYCPMCTQKLVRNGLTFITIFSTEYYEAFKKAIDCYNQLSIAKVKLEIRETSNGCSGYGLWRHPTEKHVNLSLFWDIYELAKLKRITLLKLLQEQELQKCNNLK